VFLKQFAHSSDENDGRAGLTASTKLERAASSLAGHDRAAADRNSATSSFDGSAPSQATAALKALARPEHSTEPNARRRSTCPCGSTRETIAGVTRENAVQSERPRRGATLTTAKIDWKQLLQSTRPRRARCFSYNTVRFNKCKPPKSGHRSGSSLSRTHPGLPLVRPSRPWRGSWSERTRPPAVP
jgi:hypothetical protein